MRELRMANGRVESAPKIRLECTRCHGGDGEAPGGAYTDFEREGENVVRCVECGKRHSTDSLVDLNTPGA